MGIDLYRVEESDVKVTLYLCGTRRERYTCFFLATNGLVVSKHGSVAAG